MKSIWRAGDFATSRCPRCRKLVRARFEFRTVQLHNSQLAVRDVLVDVCPECDHMISSPPQAIPQLREAGVPK